MGTNLTPASKANAPVICFNANPAIERTCQVDNFQVGTVNRIQSYRDSASGKAAIVARAIANLGFEAIQVGPLAGSVGERFRALSEAEGLAGDWVWVNGQTRTNITIVDHERRLDTIINETGPRLSEQEWDLLVAALLGQAKPGVPLCISGSMPKGVREENLSKLMQDLRELGVPVFVDSSGSGLKTLLSERPWCAKFNRDEAKALLGVEAQDLAETAKAAEQLVDLVESFLIITVGSEGAIVAFRDGNIWHVTPPKIAMISGVGSGDTFLGALVCALYYLEMEPIAAIEFASAAGALNATKVTQGEIDLKGVQHLAAGAQTNSVILREGA